MIKRSWNWTQWLKEALKQERPGVRKTLVEIWGKNRVLIENHDRVLGYSPDQICIKVSYGELCVSGKQLVFAKLSAEQLVITGCVESVLLAGGCSG